MTNLATAQKEDPSPKCHAELVRDPKEDQSEETPGEHASSKEVFWRNYHNFMISRMPTN